LYGVGRQAEWQLAAERQVWAARYFALKRLIGKHKTFN
jgi:hypothetical protein